MSVPVCRLQECQQAWPEGSNNPSATTTRCELWRDSHKPTMYVPVCRLSRMPRSLAEGFQ
ncbi:hypothetical protein AMTR_s00129p00030090 [Amborella trichopoda]|uniref:Uncharacterized protein n=1 Tax=Amborella trichopoda TaxID=13333 RepID=W1NKI9_AMBTC|nr:hypothetical protein AMTR_s00129p00030090 [Amborella trichopoda]